MANTRLASKVSSLLNGSGNTSSKPQGIRPDLGSRLSRWFRRCIVGPNQQLDAVLPLLTKLAEHEGFALYRGYETIVLKLDTAQVWSYETGKCMAGMSDVLRFCERFASLPTTLTPAPNEVVYIVWSKLLSLSGPEPMQAIEEELVVWKQAVTTWRWILEMCTMTKKDRVKGRRMRTVMDWYYSLTKWERVNLPSSSPSLRSSRST